MVADPDDDRVLGEVGFARFDVRRRAAVLGWWVAAPERGRGVAVQALVGSIKPCGGSTPSPHLKPSESLFQIVRRPCGRRRSVMLPSRLKTSTELAKEPSRAHPRFTSVRLRLAGSRVVNGVYR